MAKRQKNRVTRLGFFGLALPLLALTAVCSTVRAEPVNLGLISWDVLNPGAVNGFRVFNLTSYFSSPPDFPVVGDVIFRNAEVVLTDGNGARLAPIPLDDLGPGFAQPPSLQFLFTASFQSAEFKATLNGTTFSLYDGSILVADTVDIDALLLPGTGPNLWAGVDLVPITVTGTVTAAPIPEPSGWFLLLTVAFASSALRKSKRLGRLPTRSFSVTTFTRR